jgi:hypothetical protein
VQQSPQRRQRELSVAPAKCNKSPQRRQRQLSVAPAKRNKSPQRRQRQRTRRRSGPVRNTSGAHSRLMPVRAGFIPGYNTLSLARLRPAHPGLRANPL